MRSISIFLAAVMMAFLTNVSLAQDLNPLTPEAEALPEDAALATLVETLEDPEARERLIEALRQVTQEDIATEEPEAQQTLAARIAETSVEAINDLTDQLAQVARDVGRFGVLPELLDDARMEQIRTQGMDLLLTIIVTVLIYRGLRIVSRRIRIAAGDGDASLSGQIVTFAAQLALRIVSVIVAWVAGYFLATFVLSEGGIALPQALYLNAFLAFSAFSIVLSTLVSRHQEDLSFSKLPADVEAVIYRNVRNVFGVLFYGLIAAVPIVQSWSNFVIARSLRTVIITIVAILALIAIRRIVAVLNRRPKAEILPVPDGEEETLSDTLAAGSITLWERIWPWLAYLYVAVAYLVALANPNEIVDLVGRASLMSALALVAVLLGLRLLSAATGTMQISVPGTLHQMLPSLSARLSGFLPALCVLASLVLFVAAFLLIVDGWRVLDIAGWLSDGGRDLLWRVATVVLVLAALAISWAFLTSWIDSRLSVDDPSRTVSARSRTLLALFRNAATISLVVFGGMTALSELGVDIAPLLAGAGVIGLAVGFGAQRLVQDIITGVFIQLENAINEGDVVTVAGITGAVERLTIRSVGIRDLSGVYHLIPFSAVDTVGNYMRLFAYHVEVVGVAYDSDLEVAERALHDAFDAVVAGPLGSEIIAPLEYHGVVALGESAVNLRARIKTKPGQQWAVGRAYTQEVKRSLDKAGIVIPFPHRELKLPQAMLDRLAGGTGTDNPKD